MARADGLCDSLWQATRRLHTEAETTGFVNDVLRARASRRGYVLFLRNLLPVYEALESALCRHAEAAGPLHALARPEIYRSQSIRSDIEMLHGAGWAAEVPVLESGAAYGARVAASAARGAGTALAAHAYTRYLGDLNGGQVLARLLTRGLGLPTAALSFYDFPGIPVPKVYAGRYRQAIDGIGLIPGVARAEIVEEACASFACAIALSLEVASVER